MCKKKRIFSAIQPTGNIHLGNYLGAISQWIPLQVKYESIFSVVDLHTLTIMTFNDNINRKKYSREVVALYIACGIDLKYSSIFIQSHIHQHVELAWILNCITPIGWLERMTQYKFKLNSSKNINAGLLNYPILMAADILLYNIDFVPVGKDQKQHIELTSEIARKFNEFGDIFKIPKALISESGSKIMGLDNPSIKMSKSIGINKKYHMIGLLDDEKDIKKSIMLSITDSNKEMRFDYASDGIKNLIIIAEVLSNENREQISNRFSSLGYSYFKKYIFELVIDTLKPIQKRFYNIIHEKDYLDLIIKSGREKVTPIAENTMNCVRDAVGIGL